jgi:hypothetical protein
MSIGVVQAKGVNGSSITLDAAPTAGNFLVAFVYSGILFGPNTGWTDSGIEAPNNGLNPVGHLFYKQAGVGESATQNLGSSVNVIHLYEVSGFDDWNDALLAHSWGRINVGNGNAPTGITVTQPDALAIVSYCATAAVTLTGDLDENVITLSTSAAASKEGLDVGTYGANGFTGPSSGGTSLMIIALGPGPPPTVRAGITVEHREDEATFTLLTGSASSNYPLSNLGDCWDSSNVARLTPSGGNVSFKAVLPQDRLLQFLGLVNHNATAGQIRARFFSDTSLTTVVWDSGVVDLWPSTSPFRATRPMIALEELTVRAVQVDLTGLSGAIDIGACVLARFWKWPGLSPGTEIGLRSPTNGVDFAGGGGLGSDAEFPRIYNGQIDYLPMAQVAARGLDFQGLKGQARPAVFVEDNSSDAWPRTTFLCRNQELPPHVGAIYRHDKVQIRLVEWLR